VVEEEKIGAVLTGFTPLQDGPKKDTAAVERLQFPGHSYCEMHH
jgi:hypothetical protein